MLQNSLYHTIGLMSGSSLDGLDICYVQFNPVNTDFEYKILQANCIEYSERFRERLRQAPNLSAMQLAQLHTELGKYFGETTAAFIQQHKIEKIDFICSHGQTIFHQPLLGFTSQIGCGAQIAAKTNCKVICDLRTTDIAYGGQGAPIVPIAEKYLFPDYSTFLNIGGIANISHQKENYTSAFDVCAANTLLNYLAKQKNLVYDKDGLLARKGTIIPNLLAALNNIEFCKKQGAKSLGTEHIFQEWISLFEKQDGSMVDKLSTAVEHIAMQIGQTVQDFSVQPNSAMLVTGGGALNTFLIERIQHFAPIKVEVPDILTVQYKEALAMAFFGLLRLLELPNCVASVTGAKKDTIGGAIYLP